MPDLSFKNFYQEYQKFSLEDQDLILKTAPQIRMLRQGKTARSIVQAYPFRADLKVDPKLTASCADPAQAIACYQDFYKEKGHDPAYLILDQKILFCIGASTKQALNNYAALFEDSGQKASYENSDQPAFAPSVYQKVCFVTGAAQGLGQGIASYLVDQGAYTVIADLNDKGAGETADNLCQNFGPGTAIPVKINVADEEDVQAAFRLTVAYYGGLDLLVSNAGVVRAGSLDELSLKDFNFVTSINYTAYFITVKYAQKIMKIQHQVDPDYWMDIIQINSKSGLVGSKNNFAYAGSKFGGIGLTQSFALELADHHIKVNAICPGNNLDGPLWSDPVNGLYVQYLHSGKVKGAKTVEDVREYYLGKVPMRKGVVPSDLGKAVCYLVEQENETGQALPVSGGQEMLN